MSWLKRLTLAAGALGALAVGALVVWPIGKMPSPISQPGNVQRGAYLARASGCISCHTNKEEGGAALAGGAGLATEFGTFYPPNLTTDKTHGIGGWTIEQFARAVRQGISPDGHPYYPAFAYPFYADFTDQDIADLWAAFQTVPPVAKAAPEHEVGFPFNQRSGLKLWRAAFLHDPPTEPVSEKSARWNRGRELVRGAAHCGACHTPRNIGGGRKLDAVFAGSDTLPGENKAPAITPQSLSEQGWTVSNLAYALRTGVTPSGDAFGGGMAEIVQGNTRFLSKEDLEAMAVYLLDGDEPSPDRVAQGAGEASQRDM